VRHDSVHPGKQLEPNSSGSITFEYAVGWTTGYGRFSGKGQEFSLSHAVHNWCKALLALY